MRDEGKPDEDVQGERLRKGIAESGDDAEGQGFRRLAETEDDVEGQSVRKRSLGETEDDVEGQTVRKRSLGETDDADRQGKAL